MPSATAADMYKNLRSRSQSPSTLALQIAEQQSRKLSSTLQRRRESDARSVTSNNKMTPSSSRSNLRTASNMNNSTHTLNKLLQTRNQLKKSQENLLLAAGIGDDVSTSNVPMSRSRSIGNLKFSTARPTRTLNNNTFGGLGTFDE